MSKTKIDANDIGLTAPLSTGVSVSAALGYGVMNSASSTAANVAYSYNGVAYGYVGHGPATVGGASGNFGIRSESNLCFGAGGFGEDMRLTTTGRLLIGSITDNALGVLQVTGTMHQAGAATVLLANAVSTASKAIVVGNGNGSGLGVGDLYLGKEGSVAGGTFTNASAYANVLYSLTTLEIIRGAAKITMSSSNFISSVEVTAPRFRSISGGVIGTHNVVRTLYALPNDIPALYMVFANIGNVTDTANYGVCMIVATDGTSSRVLFTSAATKQTIGMSGLNVQSTQTSGVSQQISFSITCLG